MSFLAHDWRRWGAGRSGGWGARLLVVGFTLAALTAAATGLERARLAPDRHQVCARVGAEMLDHDGVRVFVGSSLSTDGHLTPGRVPRCDEDSRASAAFLAVRDALGSAGWSDAPLIGVHVAPTVSNRAAIGLAATHEGRGEVLLLGIRPPDPSVLAHELAHAVVLARRASDPRNDGVRRMLAVIDEALADFAASVATGSPVVGDPTRGPIRDLTRPPDLGAQGWGSIALPREQFDPQLLGWGLASALHGRAPGDRMLRDDVAVAAANAEGETVRDVLASFIGKCPSRSRPLLASAIAEWVPVELGVP